jgi:hypothetical protein
VTVTAAFTAAVTEAAAAAAAAAAATGVDGTRLGQQLQLLELLRVFADKKLRKKKRPARHGRKKKRKGARRINE